MLLYPAIMAFGDTHPDLEKFMKAQIVRLRKTVRALERQQRHQVRHQKEALLFEIEDEDVGRITRSIRQAKGDQ